jgi:hypothetical protein
MMKMGGIVGLVANLSRNKSAACPTRILFTREMIERKETYFAKYDRMILDYELVDRSGDYHVSAMSSDCPGRGDQVASNR